MPFSGFQLFPERASNLAGQVDAVFYTLVTVCGLITLLIAAAIVIFGVRYRHGSPAPRPRRQVTSLTTEIIWTGLTLAVFLGIFLWSAVVYYKMSRPPANAVEIHIIGKQWMWKAQHPNGRREIDELHIPAGQPVKLIMTSQDVIHSFFIPAFRTKQDVLPGRYTTEWFTPTKPGRYHLYCAEYCGMDHSGMGGWIYVMDPAEHARWLAQGNTGESIVAGGARLFQARGCSGCHGANAIVRAPPLEGVFGRPVALADSRTVLADEQYLRDSILLPQKEVVAGYAPVMPTFQGQLSDEELMQLIAYIKALTLPTGASTP